MSFDAYVLAHDALGRVLVLYTERFQGDGPDQPEAILDDDDLRYRERAWAGGALDRALVFHRPHSDAPYFYRDGSGVLLLEDLRAEDRAVAERFVLRADAATMVTFPATALERGQAAPAGRAAVPPSPDLRAPSTALDAGAARRSMAERLAAGGWYARLDRSQCPETWWELAGPDGTAPGPFPSSPRRALTGAQVAEVTDRITDAAGRLTALAFDCGWQRKRSRSRLLTTDACVLVAAAGRSDDPERRSRAQEARRTLVEDQRLRWHLVWSFAPMLEASLAPFIAARSSVPRASSLHRVRRGILKAAATWDERKRTTGFFETADWFGRSEVVQFWDRLDRMDPDEIDPEVPDLLAAPADTELAVHRLELALDSMPHPWLQELSGGGGTEDAMGWLVAVA
jgi:hypothetical protein